MPVFLLTNLQLALDAATHAKTLVELINTTTGVN